MEAVTAAKEYISPKRAEQRKTTTVEELKNHIQLMYGGVMIGYPAYHGLGEWEPCRVIFEDKTDILKKMNQIKIITNLILLACGMLVKN